jgi:RNA polymerase sigma factor (sigma-70 family)
VDPELGGRPDFDAVYPEIARQVRKLARRMAMAGHGDIEETVVQEALASIASRWQSYDPATPLRTWVWGNVRLCVARRRRLSATDDVPDDVLEASVFGPEEQALGEVRYRDLLDRLRAMDEERRIVFELRELDGFTMNEIAEMLGTSVARVATRLRAAWREIEAGLAGPGGAKARLGIERQRAGRGRLSFS